MNAMQHALLDTSALPFYEWLDVPAWVRRFVGHWRPDAAGFVESEIWPNLLAACAARGVPTMLINARLSQRSAARWRQPAAAGLAHADGWRSALCFCKCGACGAGAPRLHNLPWQRLGHGRPRSV